MCVCVLVLVCASICLLPCLLFVCVALQTPPISLAWTHFHSGVKKKRKKRLILLQLLAANLTFKPIFFFQFNKKERGIICCIRNNKSHTVKGIHYPFNFMFLYSLTRIEREKRSVPLSAAITRSARYLVFFLHFSCKLTCLNMSQMESLTVENMH